MENNESNLKPQPTGGLKLMTVFIAVLALHVLVIGGFTVWHLLNPSANDSDLAMDKAHKGAKIASDATLSSDVSSADGTTIDKPTNSTATASTDVGSTGPVAATDVAGPPAPTPANASTSDTITPKPAREPLMVTPPPVADDASSIAANPPTSQTASGPIQHGPVVNPPDNLAPPADASSTASSSPTATVPADGETPVTDGTPYTVKKGDSLARIAHRHHVALARLKTANSLSNDRLSIGQKLVIPNRAEKQLATADASESASVPQLTSSDSADTTTTPPAVSTAAVTEKPAHLHAHKTAGTAGGHHLYTVVKGDTLMKIARKFRTTAGAIMAANNITNASRLSIGKRLRIPAGESRSAAASARESAPTERETKTSAHGQLANYVP